jgi:two-component system, OmpR family, response regulator
MDRSWREADSQLDKWGISWLSIGVGVQGSTFKVQRSRFIPITWHRHQLVIVAGHHESVMRVLVVEDDERLAGLLKRGLAEESHVVDVVHDGRDGLDMAEDEIYDAVILDVMLPGRNGFEISSQMREDGIGTPILMLTARETLADRLEGFRAGADDYLTKPFAFEELSARLRAITRRGSPLVDDQRLTVGDLVMDLRAHEVTRGGHQVQLSPREYLLLEYLMRNPGQALTRTMILERVWDYSFDSVANVVDASIRRLRKAIDDDFDDQLIHTVRGVGYKIKEP